MKFKWHYNKHKHGDTKTITKFCWLPYWFHGHKEHAFSIWWLTRITITKRYIEEYSWGGSMCNYWKVIRVEDNKK